MIIIKLYFLLQREMKVARIMEERALALRQDAKRMEELRQKFLEGLKKYFGVPYAKRYHEEDCKELLIKYKGVGVVGVMGWQNQITGRLFCVTHSLTFAEKQN